MPLSAQDLLANKHVHPNAKTLLKLTQRWAALLGMRRIIQSNALGVHDIYSTHTVGGGCVE